MTGTWTRAARIGATAAIAAMLPAVLETTAAAQTLEIATDASPSGLDPHVATAFATVLVNGNIYEGLTAIDSGLRTVPALAEAWEVSPDGLTYSFRLRANATFHTGAKVTAADVIASFDRVRATATGSPYASRLAVVDTAAADGEGVVRVKLKEPSAPFLTQLATIAIVPASVAANPASLAREPVGTGPFKFATWVPDTYIQLDRHAGYHEAGLPKLASVKFNIVPEPATRQVGITGGTYQMLPSIDAPTALSLQGQPGVRVLESQDLAYSLVGMNVSKPPFDKAEVREALNLALNRGELVKAVYFDKGEPAGPLSPALKDWALPVSEFGCYRSDPARARQLLQQAGLTLPVKVTLKVIGSLKQAVDASQVVQAQLAAAGFEVTLDVQEQGRFIQDWRNSNFDGFVSLNSGGPDPDDYFGRTFQTGGATNVFKYSNPEVDAMLSAARASTNMAERQKIYADVQKILACRGPIAHLAYGTLFTAVRNGVGGYEMIANRSTRYLRQTTLTR